MTIHTNDPSVQAIARAGFPSYKGRTFEVEVHADRGFNFPGNYWDDGSRSTYALVRLADKHTTGAIRPSHPVFERKQAAMLNERGCIPPDCAIVEHCISCGKDLGLRVHIHADNAAKLIPAPVELTFAEKCVLHAASAFKNTYGGQTGIRKSECCSKGYLNQGPGLTPAEYDAALESLKARGMVRKNGSLTNDGRNAAGHGWPERDEVTS